MNSDNWDDWYWMAKDFLIDPEFWKMQEDDCHRIAFIMTSEKMMEIVRFFEAQGICFEPEDEPSNYQKILDAWEKLPQVSFLTKYDPVLEAIAANNGDVA